MENIYKDKLPNWYAEIDPKKYYLVLTNDLDSYLSCRILINLHPELEIGGFFDFESLYLNTDKALNKEPIYVDCDLVHGKCFGNHRTPHVNTEAININSFVAGDSYTEKFAGSTLLTIISLYELNFNDCRDETMLFLPLIDIWYKQYYTFNRQWHTWSRILDVRYLEPFLRRKSIAVCNALIEKYNLHSKIEVAEENNTYILKSNIKFQEIENDFVVNIKPLDNLTFDQISKTFSIGMAQSWKIRENSDKIQIFSCAETFKNKCIYSYDNASQLCEVATEKDVLVW